ncbi:hypothetical protein [Brevibacillus laterosporus]|uniref:hypothetical protein n=1 Tax=Brevibacillus laterosporus TaxID=1465 RepID=UPI00144427F4|nr:hypothetical protein [Brevibacillus laterosporus]NKQ20709.1 hypothetical protein [Brevibacillus laterosporus]WNX29682.1 hypothetical protein RWW94_15775 [Brevibacillus laterosporus]
MRLISLPNLIKLEGELAKAYDELSVSQKKLKYIQGKHEDVNIKIGLLETALSEKTNQLESLYILLEKKESTIKQLIVNEIKLKSLQETHEKINVKVRLLETALSEKTNQLESLQKLLEQKESTIKQLIVNEKVENDISLSQERNIKHLKIERDKLKEKLSTSEISKSRILTNKNILEQELKKFEGQDRLIQSLKGTVTKHKQYLELYRKKLVGFVVEKDKKEKNLDEFEKVLLKYKKIPFRYPTIPREYKRKEVEEALKKTITRGSVSWRIIMGKFNNRCAILKDEHCKSNEIAFEHFIPLRIGHGGSVEGNVYPLNQSLNNRKSYKNPFEWVKEKEIKAMIDMEKWNKLIKYLAETNGLTVIEFEQFVYWCFANPRSVDDIKEDGEFTSIELWRVSKEVEKALSSL